jgi:hypothetical protein
MIRGEACIPDECKLETFDLLETKAKIDTYRWEKNPAVFHFTELVGKGRKRVRVHPRPLGCKKRGSIFPKETLSIPQSLLEVQSMLENWTGEGVVRTT